MLTPVATRRAFPADLCGFSPESARTVGVSDATEVDGR